jgi:lysophospholipase L1-like esterase
MERETSPPAAPPVPSRPTGRLRRVWLGFGCLLLALVALELGLRATGALLGAERHGPDGKDGERVFDILCVGDSWTQGAPDGRYPDHLVERLNSLATGVRFRQINVGRAGTNSSQTLRHLPKEIARHRPDLLLVLTGNNDHHNLTDSSYWRFREERLGRASILAARARAFAHSLRVYRVGRMVWRRAIGASTANESFEASGSPERHAGRMVIDPGTHRRQLEYNLTRLVELARRNDLPVVFQTYFHFHGYRVNEVIRDVASTHGLPLVDHNLLFHTEIPPGEREALRIDDGHPNANGYARMAENIAVTLERTGLMPARSAVIPAVRSRVP